MSEVTIKPILYTLELPAPFYHGNIIRLLSQQMIIGRLKSYRFLNLKDQADGSQKI